MRLLQRLPSGGIVLTANLHENAIPPYAILSHTWGDESEEVTLDNLMHGTGRDKAGYRKITFCGEQANKDGLQHFWVDSCCIDKSNKAELQDAISSMFSWYQRSRKCYVYLPDVSSSSIRRTWEQAFRHSRWFTRGWTLQELLAPASVEFFSKEGKRLGDKYSLEQHIHEITGIPPTALQGEPLSHFSVNVRMSWVGPRQTKLAEDLAYSLLGIFGVNIPLRYSEGGTVAFARLEKEIEKLERCLRDLRLNDPYYHKMRIEHIKGGLLEGSYRWILENHDYQTWYSSDQSPMLWIKGDPGKGKTMLLCGIINELIKTKAKTALLSYFFCVATDSRVNSATAVLRGLLYMLICQQPSLVLHVRKKYDHAGKALFEDSDAWFALSEIFDDILQDSGLKNTYLIIDALDECVAPDIPKLMDFIAKKSTLSLRVKWLVSSRNWPPVEEKLAKAKGQFSICLELSAERISEAVGIYIKHRVDQLVQDGSYSDEIKDAVLHFLSSNADDTFLWVALVCENLKNTPRGIVRARLKSIPPGLDALYERMLMQIRESKDSEICKNILSFTATVYEPVCLTELAAMLKTLGEPFGDVSALQTVVSLCGSFLVVRHQTIYYVHQSAKDYLLTRARAETFPCGIEAAHYNIFVQSLEILSMKLRRNIYTLNSPGVLVEEVKPPVPDPLAALRYSCLHWIDHLCDSVSSTHPDTPDALQNSGIVDLFVRQKYLYWLEAVSLSGGMLEAMSAMQRLEDLVQGTGVTALSRLVHDARRFISYHRQAIETSPLQAYVSGLVFSPSASLIKDQFKKEEPRWITVKPSIEDRWSACLQTLESHGGTVNSVTLSSNSTRLASASDDHTIKIWDPRSGACLQTLKGHDSFVSSTVFLHQTTWLASASGDHTIKIWDVSSGTCLRTLRDHSRSISSVTFSTHLKQLASASDDCTIKLWDVINGGCLRTFESHTSTVSSVTFSHHSRWIASASHDCTVKLWNVDTGTCQKTLRGHHDIVNSVAFSHNSTRLASASDDRTIRIWDPSSGQCTQALSADRGGFVVSLAFSHDSEWLVSASSDRAVRLWDTESGTCIQLLEGHSGTVTSVAFSHDSSRLVSASHDRTIRIWDTCGGVRHTTETGHSDIVSAVTFSPDLARVASASYDRTIKIWDAESGTCLQTLEVDHNDTIDLLAFSDDSKVLISASGNKNIRTWEANSDAYLRRHEFDHTQNDSVVNIDVTKPWTSVHGPGKLKTTIHSIIARIRGTSLSDLSHEPLYFCTASELSQRLPESSTIFNTEAHSLYRAAEERARYAPLGLFDPSTMFRYILASARRSLVELKSLSEPLSISDEWIRFETRKLVWLPPEYRPSCSIVSGSMIGIGVGSGKVWWCDFNVAKISPGVKSSSAIQLRSLLKYHHHKV